MRVDPFRGSAAVLDPERKAPGIRTPMSLLGLFEALYPIVDTLRRLLRVPRAMPDEQSSARESRCDRAAGAATNR